METKNKTKMDANISNDEIQVKKSVERVLINSKVSSRIDGWISRLQRETSAIRITRSDVVNFILMAHSEELSSDESRELGKLHFDEVKFSFWVARTLKNAKAKGENVTLEQLYKEYGRS
jgi:hypothetical protein